MSTTGWPFRHRFSVSILLKSASTTARRISFPGIMAPNYTMLVTCDWKGAFVELGFLVNHIYLISKVICSYWKIIQILDVNMLLHCIFILTHWGLVMRNTLVSQVIIGPVMSLLGARVLFGLFVTYSKLKHWTKTPHWNCNRNSNIFSRGVTIAFLSNKTFVEKLLKR